ncbi:MAG: ABC transporter ATP-binding protein [Solirubrobacterales bacterium]
MNDQVVIETTGLTKRFGPRAAIDDVALRVPAGTCFGFLGPNGAGKTTMIRMMLGLARPTSGSISVRGHAIGEQTQQALASVGGIVEEPAFYSFMTGRRNLEAWGALLDAAAVERIPGLLERVRLEGRADERVKNYSLGMKQRLALARALLCDPELLVLDEPTNGLDPAGMAEFRLLVREMVEQENRTVFISSHLLDEVQKMCDYVAIIDHGRVVIEGSTQELIAAGETGIEVDCDDPARARDVLTKLPAVRGVAAGESNRLVVEVDPTREAAIAINRALVQAGIGVAALAKSEQSLERRYLDITAGSTPSEAGAPQRDSPPPPPPPPPGVAS